MEKSTRSSRRHRKKIIRHFYQLHIGPGIDLAIEIKLLCNRQNYEQSKMYITPEYQNYQKYGIKHKSTNTYFDSFRKQSLQNARRNNMCPAFAKRQVLCKMKKKSCCLQNKHLNNFVMPHEKLILGQEKIQYLFYSGRNVFLSIYSDADINRFHKTDILNGMKNINSEKYQHNGEHFTFTIDFKGSTYSLYHNKELHMDPQLGSHPYTQKIYQCSTKYRPALTLPFGGNHYFEYDSSTVDQSIKTQLMLYKVSLLCSIFFFFTLTRWSKQMILTLKLQNDICSPMLQNWHIRNFIQGYLLKTILKRNNAAALSIMQNFYFIIITSQCLTLEMNFNFKDGILMVYNNMNLIEIYSRDTLNWNISHQLVIKLSSNNTLMEIWDRRLARSLATITYIKRTKSDLLDIKSQALFDQNSRMLTIFIELGMTQCATTVLKKRSVAVLCDLPLLELLQQTDVIFESEKSFKLSFLYGIFQGNLNILNYKSGIIQVLREKINSKMKMFPVTYINTQYKQIQSLTVQCWSQVTTKNSCESFLRCLGQSLLTTIFSCPILMK